jgi:hypothetical protein
MARDRSTSSVIMMASLGWASHGLRRQVTSRCSQYRITLRERMPFVNGFWAVYGVNASIICSSCMRSSSTACSARLCTTSTEPGRIKASSSRFRSRKLDQCHLIMKVARSSPSRSWAACIVTIAKVHAFFLRGRSDWLRHARDPSGFTLVVVLRPSKQFLMVFLERGERLVSWSVSFCLG